MSSKSEKLRQKKTKRKGTYTTRSKTTPREQHIAALQAELDRYQAMTPIGLRRVYASFPELEDLIERCAWLVSVGDPTAGRSMNPTGRGNSNADQVLEAGQRVAWFKHQQQSVREQLQDINRDLADKVEATEHERYKPSKPQCWRRGCRLYGRFQKLDASVCEACGHPFAAKKGKAK